MRTRAISPGDLVMVNKRGRVFYARVLGTGATAGLSVEPRDRRICWRQAAAREVVDHWTHARCAQEAAPPEGQPGHGFKALLVGLGFEVEHDAFVAEAHAEVLDVAVVAARLGEEVVELVLE